jgi:imidazolonepropionase-like amidohydrolase
MRSNTRNRWFGLAFILALIATGAGRLTAAMLQAARDNPPVAFVHVTVIDGTGAAARANQTVVTSGGRIVAVGSSSNVRVPPGARVIDSTGHFLIPGLWDAHVHTRYEAIDHFRLLIANGVTSARNTSAPWEYLPQILAVREQIGKGERIGPQLLTAGPVLDGPVIGGSFRPTNEAVSNPDEGRQAVRRTRREGADFVKVYNLLSRETYFAIVAEAAAQGLPFVGHVPFAISAGEASDAGQRSIEHLDGILWSSSTQEERIREQAQDYPRAASFVTPKLLADSFSLAKLRALADRLKANETAVVPTLSLYRNRFDSRSASSVIASPDRLQYVPPAYAEEWKHPPVVRPRTSSEDDEQLQFQQCLTVVRELHTAGVTILAGTDVGTAFQVPGFSLHDELSLLVKAGLSEMDALQAATRNPARAFRLAHQGTIEPGMRADLVLLDANPLDDIENTRKIRTVVAGGRVFDRGDLDQMLTDVESAARAWTGTPTR